ncbi:DMT family transporter [Oleispirillum naphthae]|uniref:DMT family transporter n=1 Tax=Oleispirillum naphthae TaxID=2838853 RepID=UPI00308229A5
MLGWLARTSGNVRGALWMVLAVCLFSQMNALIKYVGQDLHPFEVAFFRAVFGFLVLLPVIAGSGGMRVFATRKPLFHLWRAASGCGAMLCFFYTLTHLPLANATALSFSQPLFLLAMAPLLLKEKVGWHRWAAALVGFSGVVIAARPGAEGFSPAAFIAVGGAFFMALAMVSVKVMSRTEAPLTILSYFSLSIIFTTLVPAIPVWRTPTAAQTAWLALIGLMGSIGQYLYIRSYRAGDASVVAPFNFLQLPVSAVLGFAVFAEIPAATTLAGGGIIVASVLYIMRREAKTHARVEDIPPPAA